MAFSLARMFSWPNSADFGILEKKLEDPCATPVALPLDFLKHITGDFSKEQELGRGGFGVVYKVYLPIYFPPTQIHFRIVFIISK